MAVHLPDSEAVLDLGFEDIEVLPDRFVRGCGFDVIGFDDIELWAVGCGVLPVVGDDDFVGLTSSWHSPAP